MTDGPPTRNLHIGFYAPTHELVDAFHRAGVEAGYESDGEPGPRPQYTPTTTARFLLDPDGNSIEAVYLDRRPRAGPDRPPVAAHARRRGRDGLLRHDRPGRRPRGPRPLSRPRAVRRRRRLVLVRHAASRVTEHVHIAFPAQRQRDRRRLPQDRDRRRLPRQRRARRARRLPPRLLRRVRPRSRRPQHRGRQPQPLSSARPAAISSSLTRWSMPAKTSSVTVGAERRQRRRRSRARARAAPSRPGRSCRDTPACPRRSPSAAARVPGGPMNPPV